MISHVFHLDPLPGYPPGGRGGLGGPDGEAPSEPEVARAGRRGGLHRRQLLLADMVKFLDD